MPKTILGKISIALIVLVPIMFVIASTLTAQMYSSVPAGNSIGADLLARPLLAGSMLLGFLFGISSFGVGLYAILKKNEASGFVYGATIIGGLLILMLAAEFIFPH